MPGAVKKKHKKNTGGWEVETQFCLFAFLHGLDLHLWIFSTNFYNLALKYVNCTVLYSGWLYDAMGLGRRGFEFVQILWNP